MSLSPSKAESLEPTIQAYYDRLSLNRWRKVGRDPILSYEFGMRHRVALQMLSPGRDMRVMEVGCGDGLFLREYADMCGQVTGLDLSRDMLLHGRRHLAGDEVSWVQGNGTRLPFQDRTFDAVVSLEVIEHVPDPLSFLLEARRVLKPGGRLVISTPNQRSLYGLFGVLVRSSLWALLANVIRRRRFSTTSQLPPYDVWRSPSELAALLHTAGFDIRDIRTACYLPGSLAYYLPHRAKQLLARAVQQVEPWLEDHARLGYSIVVQAIRPNDHR